MQCEESYWNNEIAKATCSGISDADSTKSGGATKIRDLFSPRCKVVQVNQLADVLASAYSEGVKFATVRLRAKA